MKIALCLSGQPRVVEVGYSKLYNTILKNNDVDIFIHTWFDPKNLSTQSAIPGREGHRLSPDAIEKLIQLYQPKKILVDKPKEWTRRFEYPEKTFIKAHTWVYDALGGIDGAKKYLDNASHCMWYSIMMSNLLKEQYATENNIEYDYVIRNRIDYGPHLEVEFNNSPEDDVVYYQHLEQPDGMIADWFAMGSNNAMNVYSGVFNNIGQLVKQSNERDGYWCNELLLKHHLINNDIKTEPIDLQVHY